jgi:hypothetical protein
MVRHHELRHKKCSAIEATISGKDLYRGKTQGPEERWYATMSYGTKNAVLLKPLYQVRIYLEEKPRARRGVDTQP